MRSYRQPGAARSSHWRTAELTGNLLGQARASLPTTVRPQARSPAAAVCMVVPGLVPASAGVKPVNPPFWSYQQVMTPGVGASFAHAGMAAKQRAVANKVVFMDLPPNLVL
jgi:hypothetical protein